jgi:hypothetical protein
VGRPLPKGSKRLREGARPTRSARMVLTYTRLLAGRVSLVDVLRENDRRRGDQSRVCPCERAYPPIGLRGGVRLPYALVDAAMPPIISGHLRAGKIWIDDALRGPARCRRVALRQRRVAAFVIVAPPGRTHAGKPDKPDCTSAPEQAPTSKPSRWSKSPKPECASEPPSGHAQLALRPRPDFQIASRQVPLFPVNSRSRVGAGRVLQSFGVPPRSVLFRRS